MCFERGHIFLAVALLCLKRISEGNFCIFTILAPNHCLVIGGWYSPSIYNFLMLHALSCYANSLPLQYINFIQFGLQYDFTSCITPFLVFPLDCVKALHNNLVGNFTLQLFTGRLQPPHSIALFSCLSLQGHWQCIAVCSTLAIMCKIFLRPQAFTIQSQTIEHWLSQTSVFQEEEARAWRPGELNRLFLIFTNSGRNETFRLNSFKTYNIHQKLFQEGAMMAWRLVKLNWFFRIIPSLHALYQSNGNVRQSNFWIFKWVKLSWTIYSCFFL